MPPQLAMPVQPPKFRLSRLVLAAVGVIEPAGGGGGLELPSRFVAIVHVLAQRLGEVGVADAYVWPATQEHEREFWPRSTHLAPCASVRR